MTQKITIKSDVIQVVGSKTEWTRFDGVRVADPSCRFSALEKWGLGPSALEPLNPGPSLIFTRVKWVWTDGSLVVQARIRMRGGVWYINGFVDPETNSLSGPPVRPNISLGDADAGLWDCSKCFLSTFFVEVLSSRIEAEVADLLCSMLDLIEGIVSEYDCKVKAQIQSHA